MPGSQTDDRWLVLVHHIPATPNYLRVKIGRRLDDVGALPLKSSVYVLPRTEQTLEDFQWVLREIKAGGGEGQILVSRFVSDLSDQQVQALFRKSRETGYDRIAEEVRHLLEPRGPRLARTSKSRKDRPKEINEASVRRLRKQLSETAALDFFGASGRQNAEALVRKLEDHMRGTSPSTTNPVAIPVPRGKVWVTRSGIKVDRMASAWLIRRFLEPDARLKFVPGKEHTPGPDELRFDMFEGEFTHEGDRCTFEVMLDRLGLADAALRSIAEIVHDIDLKDAKFGRPETAGVAAAVAGITLTHADDESRLAQAMSLFNGLYEQFRIRPAAEGTAPATRRGARNKRRDLDPGGEL